MKNLSLTIKIWLSLSFVSFLLYIIILLIMPFLIRNFFTVSIIPPPGPPEKKGVERQTPPTHHFSVRGFNIRSFTLLDNGATVPSDIKETLPNSFFEEIKRNAVEQQDPRESYEYKNKDVKIRYGIKKGTAYGRPIYQVTFYKRSEEEKFINSLISNIVWFTGIALIICWFASLFIARYLTKPLKQMQHHVKRIANRNWYDPLEVNNSDEIGQLADSIESMRKQLIQQDEAQQSMLQNISHELKTPVMIIRSYAQAIQDGLYPKGNLAGSIQVIDEEGKRLEKLVKQLLYLTRLDYFKTHQPLEEMIRLDKLIKKTFELLYIQRPKVTCELDLQQVSIKGNKETLKVMIENVLENHLRHAYSKLKISLSSCDESSEIILYFWNDGSKIDLNTIKHLYQPFQKGQNGRYGLGLTIVHRIVKMHHGSITLSNEKGGVSSTIKLPQKK